MYSLFFALKGETSKTIAYFLSLSPTPFTGLTAYLQSSIPDAVGSLLVGCMLAAVSALIIHSSVPALVGRSIEFDQLNKINAELESDSIIKSIHEVRGIDMGNNQVRYKVPVFFYLTATLTLKILFFLFRLKSILMDVNCLSCIWTIKTWTYC